MLSQHLATATCKRLLPSSRTSSICTIEHKVADKSQSVVRRHIGVQQNPNPQSPHKRLFRSDCQNWGFNHHSRQEMQSCI